MSVRLLPSDVRPEERRGAAAAFLTLFGILAAHTLLETARDALFLARLPASQLPWVYLAMAAVAVGLSQVQGRLPGLRAGRTLSALLAGCAAVTFGFWLLAAWQQTWVLRALYVWTGIVGTLAALEFWLILGESYTVTQAKRLYRLIALGSLLGAVSGAALARVVAGRAEAPQLVLAAALVLLATALGPALLLRRPESARGPGSGAPLTHPGRALRLLRREPYVRGLLGLTLVSTVTLTLADYVFKSAVARAVPAAELPEFFASFYVLLNGLALASQLLLLAPLMRVMGLHRALWVLPALLALGATGLALGGGVIAALLLKGADGTLRHSLHRTTSELLAMPLPDALRGRVKPLVDVVGQRGGQALASLVILSEVVLGRGDVALAAATAALALLWIALAADLRQHYLELFRAALREGVLGERPELSELDVADLEALVAAFNSSDDAEVVGAMDLLAASGRLRVIPALILYHPSRAVVLRALDLLADSGRDDFVPIADRLLAGPDPEVRAAALRARSAARPEEKPLRRATADPDPLVRATAIVGLVAGGWVSDEAQQTLDDLLRDGGRPARLALARAMRRRPSPACEPLLLTLAEGGDAELLVEVAGGMAACPSPVFLGPLLHLLTQHEVRPAARAALVAQGEAALRHLDRALGDHALPHEIRRHLPRTISQFEPAAAARVLMAHLLDEPDGMVRFKILRGLNRLAADNPGLELDRATLATAAQRTAAAALKALSWRVTLQRGAGEAPGRATPGHGLLVDLLRDKESHAVERLFRLLQLQDPGEDYRRIYRGLTSASIKVRAGSRELLEHLVEPPLREALLALVDDAPEAQRLFHAGPLLEPAPAGYEELLAALLAESSETVRCLAAYHVGELGLGGLRPRLEEVRAEGRSFFLERVVDRALALLARPRPAEEAS